MSNLTLFNDHIPIWETALRLGLAVILGMAIGWEREAKEKDAGLRTHMFVGLGSCAFMLVALALTATISSQVGAVKIDPSRVIQGLIGGIGFLGAGAIIQGGSENVRGLTTGAGIWLVGAVGLSAGAGAYTLAVFITAFALIVVLTCRRLFKPLAKSS